MITPQTLSVAEAAEILGIAPRTAYDINKRNEVKPGLRELAPGVPVFKIGGRWRVSRRHLEAFLENPVAVAGVACPGTAAEAAPA